MLNRRLPIGPKFKQATVKHAEEEAPQPSRGSEEEPRDFIMDLDGFEPPSVVVECRAVDCIHNIRSYCGRPSIMIDFRGDRGATTDATECDNYQANP